MGFVMEERKDRKSDEDGSRLALAGGPAVGFTPRAFVIAQFARKEFGCGIEKRRTTDMHFLTGRRRDFNQIFLLEPVVEFEARYEFASMFAQIGTTGIKME